MAAVSASPLLYTSRPYRAATPRPRSRSLRSSPHPLRLATSNRRWYPSPSSRIAAASAVAEEAASTEESSPVAPEDQPADQSVSVPVSPSDVLTMFFRAEGFMDESAVPAISKALQETEGVGDLNVQIVEGIATVELTKQTTVQATGVASNLVEIIQGSGFKLQALNLSFEDEEDATN